MLKITLLWKIFSILVASSFVFALVNIYITYQSDAKKLKYHVNTDEAGIAHSLQQPTHTQVGPGSENLTKLHGKQTISRPYLTAWKVLPSASTELNIGLGFSNDSNITNLRYEQTSFEQFGLGKLNMTAKLRQGRPEFNFSMTPTRILQNFTHSSDQYKKEPRWSMIVAIKSDYRRSKARKLIRQTWGSIRFLKGVRLEVIFVVGNAFDAETENDTSLLREQLQYEDILQVNITETYPNIGLKALAAMQWVGQHLPEDWIYSSADDDVLPKIPELIVGIEKIAKEINNYTMDEHKYDLVNLPMYCAYRLRLKTFPSRKKNKWHVDEKTYPPRYYPPFCLGGFYSMPVKLSSAIFEISQKYPYFRMDDVWITGFLRLLFCDTISSDGSLYFKKSDVMCALSKYPGGLGTHFASRIKQRKYLKMWLINLKKIKLYPVEFSVTRKIPGH